MKSLNLFKFKLQSSLFNFKPIFHFTQSTTKVNKEETKLTSSQDFKPEYIPLEQRTPQQIESIKQLKEKELYWHFGGKQYYNMTKLQAYFEFVAKAKRKAYLNWGYHGNTKMIIPVKRFRKLDENYISLARHKHECVVVINGRENFPELHLVVELHRMQRIYK